MSRLLCVQKTLYADFRAFKIAYVQIFVRSKNLCAPNWKICALQIWYFMRSCPDYRAFKSPQVQTFVRSKLPMSRFSCVPKENSCAPKLIICAFMSRLSCVRKTLYPDFRAFKTAYVQTFVRSKGKLMRSKNDNLCVHAQNIVRSKDLMSRLSCVQNCLCSNFRAFQRKVSALQSWYLCVYIQTIVRSKVLMSRLSCVQSCLCRDFHAFQRKIRALQNWYFVRSCPDYRAFEWPYMQTFVRSKLPMSKLSCVPKEN